MMVIKNDKDNPPESERWHTDMTFQPDPPLFSLLRAHHVPEVGGDTLWSDMRAAYDALDEATRERISHYSAYHSLHYSQSKLGHSHSEGSDYNGYGFHDGDPPLRPLVKIHPETGRRSLLIGRHAYGIPGLEAEESERLLEELVDFACQEPRIYHHTWSSGDAVLWDNRCLMHRARPWDMNEARTMFHARIAGDPKTEAAGVE